MTITVHLHDALSLRVHRIFGHVTMDQFRRLAAFYRSIPSLLNFDFIGLVDVDSRASSLMDDLDELRHVFHDVHATSAFSAEHRSAWICPNPAARPAMSALLESIHASGDASEVRLIASLEEANTLFSQEELEAVRFWSDFRELVHIDD